MQELSIGVFDSGVGGENVVSALKAQFPSSQILFRDDKKNLPYGDKTPEQLLSFLRPVIKEIETEAVDAIVVACKTITNNIMKDLRKLTKIPIVGFEPAIKPASQLTKTNCITVCATPGTLKSARYKYLKDTYAEDIKVYEPDCGEWAQWIEQGEMEDRELEKIVSHSKKIGSDVIVLGCTHYHWIEKRLQQLAGDIKVIQPTEPVIKRLLLLLT